MTEKDTIVWTLRTSLGDVATIGELIQALEPFVPETPLEETFSLEFRAIGTERMITFEKRERSGLS